MISNTIFCNPFQMSWVSHGFIWPCKSFVFSRSLWLKHKTLQSVPCLLNRAAFRLKFAILWKWIKATFFGRGWSIRGNWPDNKTSMTGQHKLLVPGKFKVSLSKYLWSHLTTFEASNFFITLHQDCTQASLSLIHSVEQSVFTVWGEPEKSWIRAKVDWQKKSFFVGKGYPRAYVDVFFSYPRSKSLFYCSCTMTSTPSFANAPFLFCLLRCGSMDL